MPLSKLLLTSNTSPNQFFPNCHNQTFLQGVPFTTGHDIVGRAVALCVSKGCTFEDLTLDDLRGINPVFDEDVYDYLWVENAVKNFCSYGSKGSECVANQLDFWAAQLEIDRSANGCTSL
ncbi:hypothetical protein RND81_09G041400 [Saponaria officinalis]|uniref:Argininosuccinate lyase C-terminal domain-containing protein n=1 Tax=Saponaria officinalis TaxID=3572 RepID=A0AAW1IIJ2_SAPOF